MGFVWNWFTKAGSDQTENQDYAGIAQWGDSLFAVIVDGVSSRPESGTLARVFTRHLVDRVFLCGDVPTSADVAFYIEDAYKQLKQSCSPCASTTYLAAYFSSDKLMYAVHAGDCRIGLQSKEGAPIWKTGIHALANATVPLTEECLRVHPARNQLTRSFGTKRYKAPDITMIECEYAQGAVLATDGFWAGLSMQDQDIACSCDWIGPDNNEDDVSRLLISWNACSSLQAHTENDERIYIVRR